jgi:hypothetical protein
MAPLRRGLHGTQIQLRLQAAGGEALGAVNWFAVHGTSMNNTNRLISGDNKGVASSLFERAQAAGEAHAGACPATPLCTHLLSHSWSDDACVWS